MASGTRVRRRRAAGALLACSAITIAALATDAAGAHAASAASDVSPAVRLYHQTPTVTAPRRLFTVVLSKTGPAAAPSATVRLVLYGRLTTRSALLAAIGATGPAAPISATPTIPASCLAAATSLRLSVTVSPDGTRVVPRRLCGHRAPVLRLGCTGGCDGVYPLRIIVSGAGTTTSLVTLVTYASVSPSPLRVCWVLRIAGRARALSGAAGSLEGVASHPRVPVTVDVEGSTLANGITRPGGAASAHLLSATATARAHELIVEPYVHADMGALQASGLTSEVTRQYALSEVALKTAQIPVTANQSVTYGTGPQTPTMADAVGTQRSHLIVDGAALVPDPAATLTWGDAFHLVGASSEPTALATDTELGQLSSQTAADPGLTAAQFLGQLAFLHFEQPDLPDPRAVVVVTTATTGVTRAFADGVLEGLATSPVLRAVTASGAFGAARVGANGFPGSRPFALGPSRALPRPTISYISFLRITTDALSSSVRGGETPIPSIEGQLLGAERLLPRTLRTAILNHVHYRLEQQLGYFHIDSGSITLTESGASLPITVLSTAPYGVEGVLRLSSTNQRIVFPQGSTQTIFIPAGSPRSVRVPARALSTGDLALAVTFLSFDRRLRMAHTDIVVRATPTSLVGIALTVGAVLVLALWWIRTSRRRRSAGR